MEPQAREHSGGARRLDVWPSAFSTGPLTLRWLQELLPSCWGALTPVTCDGSTGVAQSSHCDAWGVEQSSGCGAQAQLSETW